MRGNHVRHGVGDRRSGQALEMNRVDSQPLKELPKGFYDENKLIQKMK